MGDRDFNLMENSEKMILIFLLCISLSLVITAVSASDSTVAQNNFVYTSNSIGNSYAVKSTSDNIIYFIDTNKNAVTWTYNISRYIGSIAISPDGRYVAVGCGGGLIYVFDQQGNIVLKQQFGNALIQSISFSENNNYVDASNILNQAFQFSINGNLVVRPASPAVTSTPSATISSIPTTSTFARGTQPVASAPSTGAPAGSVPAPEPPSPAADIFGGVFFWIGVVVVIAVIVLLVARQRGGRRDPLI
jgi:WD40 repeat protein